MRFPAAASLVIMSLCTFTFAVQAEENRSAPPAPIEGLPPPERLNPSESDATLTNRVKTALAAENTLEDSQLNVNSEHGNVTVTGTVKSAADQETIATIVRELDGVLRVHVDVKVVP